MSGPDRPPTTRMQLFMPWVVCGFYMLVGGLLGHLSNVSPGAMAALFGLLTLTALHPGPLGRKLRIVFGGLWIVLNILTCSTMG